MDQSNAIVDATSDSHVFFENEHELAAESRSATTDVVLTSKATAANFAHLAHLIAQSKRISIQVQ